MTNFAEKITYKKFCLKILHIKVLPKNITYKKFCLKISGGHLKFAVNLI